ncbi:MAG: PAS domain S-box protein [Halobacteriota archaeon]
MAKKKLINILLLEDSPSDSLLVQEVLSNAQHERFTLVTASTLSKGLNELARDTFDAILLDLGLPDSQGLDTLRAVREQAPYAPLVVLTASDDEELGRRAVLKGAQRFISKDILTYEQFAAMFTRIIRHAIEQKRAESQLKAREEQFRGLFNDSPIAQVRYDAKGRPVEANKAAYSFLGIKNIADIQQWTIFTSPRVPDEAKAQLRAGHPIRYELSYDFTSLRESKYFPSTHSHVRYADVQNTPLFDANGSVSGYLAQIVDITDRKHAEEERESIARFPEENPDPVLRIGCTGQILYTNAAAEALLEAVDHREGAVPTQWLILVDEAFRCGQLLSDITAASRVFLMRFVPVPDEGYVDVYGTDITRRKEVENELLQSRKEVQLLNEGLTSANQELSILNETLEQRVRERTAELASMNEELASANEELRVANKELVDEVGRRVSAEQEARENANHIKLLHNVITAGNQADALQTAMQAMLDAAVDVLEFDGGLLYLYNERDNIAELQVWRGASEELVKQGSRVPVTLPNLAPVYRGESWFSEAYPNESSTEYQDVMKGVKATAVVPLAAGDFVVGHYGVWSTSQHCFTPHEQALFEAIGREAGTVIIRMQAEEAVKAQAELLDLAHDSVIVRTLDHHITLWNRGAEALFGWTAEEARGKYAPALLQTVYPISLDAAKRSVLENEQWTGETEVTTKTGEKRYIEQSWTLKRDNAGNAVTILNIARDITDRRRAEEQLRRYSQHLEEIVEERTSRLRDAERLASIGETAAMIGHDLRNPLQGLQYIVDLQKLRFERVPPRKRSVEDWEKEQALFDRIGQQIFYMDKIVADLQDYARPVRLERERVPISDIIHDVIMLLPQTDHVEIVSDVSDLMVMADPHLMHRVFANLILNAIQAMPDGGTLTISAYASDHAVVINIRDTGIGIAEEMKDKLFTPLTTGKAKGTGLGLAVVKRIVEAHGGTIGFESLEGKGATFIVTLPQTAA